MQIIHVPYPVRWLRRKSYNDPLDTLVITPSKSVGKKEVFDSTYHDNMVKQSKAHRAYMEKMEKKMEKIPVCRTCLEMIGQS